jgi:hypothetical protein
MVWGTNGRAGLTRVLCRAAFKGSGPCWWHRLHDPMGTLLPFALSCLLGCLQARRPLIPVYRLRGQAYCIQFTFGPREKPQVKQRTILLSISRSQRFWVIVVYSKYSCAYLFVCCLYTLWISGFQWVGSMDNWKFLSINPEEFWCLCHWNMATKILEVWHCS